MSKPNSLVNSIHFENFDGRQFERLVFAYLLRTDRWRTIAERTAGSEKFKMRLRE
jgi:hypothetical protein